MVHRYLEGMDKVTRLKEVSSDTTLWSMYSVLPKPVSARVFTTLQINHLENDGRRTGYIIMLPADLTDEPELAKLEEKGVQGRNAKVERIMELPNGNIEWRTAVCMSVGGSIPVFLVEKMIPGSIAQVGGHWIP
jgi:hypothetical protein